LNSPILETAPAPPAPAITANVGSTRCLMPSLFSVVKGSSSSPAPTPTAYSRASFDVHEWSCGSVSAPTASGLIGISTLLVSRGRCGVGKRPVNGTWTQGLAAHGGDRLGLGHQIGHDGPELGRIPAIVLRRGGAAAPAFGHRDGAPHDEERAPGDVLRLG